MDTLNKYLPTHSMTQRYAPNCVLLLCSCGWQRQFKRENALARAAKVRKAIREHQALGR